MQSGQETASGRLITSHLGSFGRSAVIVPYPQGMECSSLLSESTRSSPHVLCDPPCGLAPFLLCQKKPPASAQLEKDIFSTRSSRIVMV